MCLSVKADGWIAIYIFGIGFVSLGAIVSLAPTLYGLVEGVAEERLFLRRMRRVVGRK